MKTAFDSFHPVVSTAYFIAILVFAMAAFQPVFIALSLLAGMLFNILARGLRAACLTFAWQLPIVAIIALANPIFSAAGSTVLFELFDHPFYAESLVYGVCMGGLLMSTMLWFSNASQVLSSDKVMSLTGRAIPTVGLMVTMTMRLVPQFVKRGNDIQYAARACTSVSRGVLKEVAPAAATAGAQAESGDIYEAAPDASAEEKSRLRRLKIGEYARQVSVLMGWGMEDSLEMSDAMRSRGWGAQVKRTTYERVRFRKHDAVACVFIGALILTSAITAATACLGFQFYAKLSGWVEWWVYIPYVALLAVPYLLKLKEIVQWRS